MADPIAASLPAAALRCLVALATAGATMLAAALSAPALAQPDPATVGAGWTQCSALPDNAARLACFDRWAAQQRPGMARPVATSVDASAAPPPTAPLVAPSPAATAQAGLQSTPNAPAQPAQTGIKPCADPRQSELSRFWELEKDSDCGVFGIRGYRPLSLSWIGSDSVNTAPSSPTAGHTAAYTAYGTSETRIQLSVRTKIARGLLTDSAGPGRDSLWFGYTQQSYWQLFNGTLSRPFRSTDHEPELTYVYPLDAQLGHGWRLRYAGLSAVHQSNGQSLPLSRSWNRAVLMAGMERGDNLRLLARAWARIPESDSQDDNPGISNYVGRAELAGFWNVDKANTLGLTLRHSLRADTRGSVRLEWLTTLGNPQADGDYSSLRFHTQLFSGYGDSLLDYNRRRTVLSIGLSLVDF